MEADEPQEWEPPLEGQHGEEDEATSIHNAKRQRIEVEYSTDNEIIADQQQRHTSTDEAADKPEITTDHEPGKIHF